MQSRLSTKQTLRALAMLLAFASVISFTRSSAAVYAQSATASLSGVAMDEKGAVVAGAKITLVNAATALKREAKTNSDGLFTLPLVPPGNYTVSAQCDGFRPVDLRDITLNVGDQRSVQITLRVGSVTASVEVAGGASLLNESPAVGTVVDRQFVQNIPLNGRSFQSLIHLTPGVVPVPGSFSRGGQFVVNGQRENSNYFTVDGVSANTSAASNSNLSLGGNIPSFNAQGTTNSLVSVDALQEFKVLTSTFAPEYGRTPGAQVQIVTRSGENDFHGVLFEYLRNDALDANDFFNNALRLPRPPLRQNQFGGVFGGPLFLPRFGEGGRSWYDGRNRTFFFFSYEGLRLLTPQTRTGRPVPSLAARQRATGAIRDIFNAFPVPNGRDLGDGRAEVNASFSTPSSADTTSIRIDHTLSNKLTLFGRYNHSVSDNTSRGGAATGGTSLSTVRKNEYKSRPFTVGATFIASPRITNDLRLNYSRDDSGNNNFLDDFGGAIIPPDSSLFPSYTSSAESFVQFNLIGGSGANGNIFTGKDSRVFQQQFNLVNTLSLSVGSHQLRFGVDYRRLAPKTGFTVGEQALNNFSIQAPGVNALLDTGRLATVIVVARRGAILPRFTNFSAFAQDTWRATPRLTLTYGLRYDINPIPSEKNGNYPLTVNGLENPAAISLAPIGTRPFETTYNNFAPRVGAAYQLSRRPGRETVLRGGFGLFYDLLSPQVSSVFSANAFPNVANRTLTNIPFTLDGATLALPPVGLTTPYLSITAFEPDLKLPYALQFNTAIEQSFGANQTVSATYVGAIGRRLNRTERFPTTSPNFTTVNLVRDTATSDYHALQMQYNRRLSRGLQALASYTWSHSIDSLSSDVLTIGLPATVSTAEQDRGSSDFDVRHAFSAAATYNIPAPQTNRIVNAVLRDFSIDATFKAYSAAAVNVVASNTATGTVARPDLVPGQPLYLYDETLAGGRRFNPAAFARVPNNVARQGSLGRNALRAFPFSQLDFAFRRQFNFAERVRLHLRAEMFNLLNTPNFAPPSGSLDSGTFGRATQMLNRGFSDGFGGMNPLYQIGGPRSIQLALRLQF